MKLYQKISLGFLGSFVLLGGLGYYFLHNNYQLQSRNKQAFEQARIESETITDLSQSLYLIQAYARELIFLAESNSPEKIRQEYVQKIKAELRNVDANVIKGVQTTLIETRTIISKNEADLEAQAADLGTIKQIDREIIQYKQNLNKFLYILSQGKIEEAKNFYRKHLSEKIETTLMPLIEEYKDNSLADIKRSEELITDRASNYLRTVKSYLLLGWLVSLIWFIYIYYSIYSPLQKIEDNLAWQQAKGILNKNIDPQTKTKNELKNLIDVFNSLVNQLKQAKNSNARLNRSISSLDDSIIVINYEREIELVNPAALKLLGYEKKELLGHKIQKILEKNTKIDLREFLEQEGEINYITKDNKKKTVAVKCAIIENQNSDRDSIIFVAKDINQQPKNKKALKESEERYNLAIAATRDGILEWDRQTKKVNYSPRWREMLGYEESEIGSTLKEWFERVHSDDLKLLKQKFVAYLKGKTSQLEVSYKIRHKDGYYLPVFCRSSSIKDANGTIIRTILAQSDLTESKKTEEKLHYQSTHDRLTGLPNREFLLEKSQKLLDLHLDAIQANDNYSFAIISISLEGFKLINNSFGAKTGDRLLIDVRSRLTNYLGKEYLIAKLRADRFAIVLENIKDVKEAIILAENIQKQFTQPVAIAEYNIPVTAKLGIAVAKETYSTSEQLIADAETASDCAKNSQVNHITVFEPSMRIVALNRLQLASDLNVAIAKEQFQVYYQPIVELTTNKIIGFEALTRWQHPSKGLISEDEFMSVAVETGASAAINLIVIRQAISQIRQWQEQYFLSRKIFLCANIGDLKFVSEDLASAIDTIVRETGFNASNLQLKFTETAIEEKDLKVARKKLDRLKAKGVKVSLGNFARSYSSLAYLGSLAIDNLEIDRSTIADIENNRAKSEIIGAIVNFASGLGLSIFAAGIDNVKQANLLIEKNCQYGRGAFFCGAVTNEVAEALIASQNISSKEETSDKEQQGVTRSIAPEFKS